MTHHLSLALLGTLALAPNAFAQETTTDTASGSHFAVVGGVGVNKPTGDARLGATRADIDGEAVPTLSASYFVNDNVAIEAWGADKAGHRVSTNGRRIASVESQPVAVSGQYHFGSPDRTVRPFVGVGYHQTNFTGETAQAGGPLAGQRIGVDTVRGPMATVGADVKLSKHMFARGDVRYLYGDSDVALNGVKAGEVNAQPVVVGLGLGARW